MENQWEKAMQAVNNMPADYWKVIESRKKGNPNAVRVRQLPTGEIYTVDLGHVNGYECELQVRDSKKKNITEAQYYLWNAEKGTVYSRDLLSLPTL